MAPELGLDLKLTASKIVSTFSKDASSSIDSHDRKIAKLQQYFANLEEERRKIEVFKRELPLCMFILNEVIEGVKAELNQCRNQKPRVLEEFMPIKSKSEEEVGEGVKSEEKESKDKMKNWMSSAQLWSDKYRNEEDDDDRTKSTNENDDVIQENDESDHRQESSDTVSFESKSRNFGGAFVPFNRDLPKKEDKVTADLPDLALVVPPRPRSVSTLAAVVSSAKPIARCQVSPPASSHVSLQSAQQQAATRKARRCWSPELHRRFVVALQQLGGAQVATPKQIRELMKVDGLTNDEVKSHLQKYRLHTRRAPHSSSSSQSVVVLGGLWVPPLEHYSASQSLQSASQSGSPQGPLQLTGSSRAVSVTVGDSCEEDGKSESYSWK